MKITVFGANGGSGKRLVEVALAAGHEVVAAVRSPDKVATKDNLRAVKADVLDRASVMDAVEGADAVLSTIGPTDNKNPGTLLSEGTKNMVAAYKILAEASIRASAIVHWVIVRPPMLDDSPARGDYIHGVEAPVHPGHALSHADVAAFMLRCAVEDEFAKTIQRVGHR